MVKLTMIARVTDGLPLAEGLDDGRDLQEADRYKQQVKQLFKNLSRGQNEPSRMSVETGPYVFHYIIEGWVCYLTMCDRSYPKKLAFQYLEDLKNEFERVNSGDQIETAAQPYAFIKFDTFIQRTKKLYQDTQTQRNISKLNDELYEVHQIMTRNVQEVLGVGEKLNRSSEYVVPFELESGSKRYRSGKIKKKACNFVVEDNQDSDYFSNVWLPSIKSNAPYLLVPQIISDLEGKVAFGYSFSESFEDRQSNDRLPKLFMPNSRKLVNFWRYQYGQLLDTLKAMHKIGFYHDETDKIESYVFVGQNIYLIKTTGQFCTNNTKDEERERQDLKGFGAFLDMCLKSDEDRPMDWQVLCQSCTCPNASAEKSRKCPILLDGEELFCYYRQLMDTKRYTKAKGRKGKCQVRHFKMRLECEFDEFLNWEPKLGGHVVLRKIYKDSRKPNQSKNARTLLGFIKKVLDHYEDSNSKSKGALSMVGNLLSTKFEGLLSRIHLIIIEDYPDNDVTSRPLP